MTDSRLPENTQDASRKSDYFKFKDGDNKIRILTSPIIWYEYFTSENKPLRSKEMFKETPDMKDGGKVKQFRAFLVYNYDENQIQVMSITQASIKKQLTELTKDSDFWSPLEYDIKINKTGEKLDTEYQVKPLSKSPLAKEISEARFDLWEVDLTVLYTNWNPLSK